ncbi:hydroxyisourate hydrolase [Nocardioides sp. InS609-2]|uniref:hydroxyisourate hydrolase n=1 Tax=Nocardioides sp. InS609-2 TaxID=2760705 RepID=UPI00183D3AC7|nr:hydroxyisourate hydrolase [Nocardioides sp. InS609-2]MBA3781060.1 hydroxyisourate hydrolase [Nocardioides sp.]
MSISTHVLDAAQGTPAEGMALRLERQDGTVVGSGTTNADGRCPELTEGLVLEAGTYRMRFETGAWFARTQTPTFYPGVELVFEVADPAEHYHVPLLLSPFAYSTYRGS